MTRWARAALEVARRDATIYLRSPLALVVAAAFLVLEGVSFTALVTALADPARPGPLGAVFEGHFGGTLLHWTLQLTVLAALAARVVEDRRSGTWEALVTAPVPEGAAIAGAWLAALGFYAVLWIPTVLYVVVLVHFAPAGIVLDLGPLAGAYGGEVMIGGAGLALALAAGAWSTQPAVATVAGFGVLLLWLLLGELPTLQPELVVRAPAVAAILERGGPRMILVAMARGELRGESLLALVGMAVGGLRIATAVAGIRRRRRGAVPVGIAEGVLWIVIWSLAGVLVGRAGGEWDVTAAGRNSLTSATRTVLARLGEPMTATVVRPGIAGLDPIFEEVERVLARMRSVQPALATSHWDPLTDPAALPAAAAAAAIDEPQLLRGGAVLLARGERRRAVALLDLASLDRDALEAPSVKTLRIESALAQAIAELIDDTPVRVCATRGHGELRIDAVGDGGGNPGDWSAVAARLRADGIGVESIDVSSGVPATCRVIVVMGPVAPLSATEAMAVASFLDGGGAALVALSNRDPDDGGFAVTGLETVLARWGVTTPPAWAIDPSLAIALPLALRVVDGYAAHPITAGFAGRRYSLWQRARPVVVSDGVALVQTTDAGWGETARDAPPARDARDLPGPIALAAAIERGRGRLVVFGSAAALAASSSERGHGGDLLGAQAIAWLARRAPVVEVPAKNPEVVRLVMTAGERRAVAAIALAVIPLSTLMALWWLGRRRRRP